MASLKVYENSAPTIGIPRRLRYGNVDPKTLHPITISLKSQKNIKKDVVITASEQKKFLDKMFKNEVEPDDSIIILSSADDLAIKVAVGYLKNNILSNDQPAHNFKMINASETIEGTKKYKLCVVYNIDDSRIINVKDLIYTVEADIIVLVLEGQNPIEFRSKLGVSAKIVNFSGSAIHI